MTDDKTPRKRLHRIERANFFPLERSSRIQDCALYWLPVYSDPLVWREKQWLMAFFDELHAVLEKKYDLRQESFLQMKVVAPLGIPKDLLHAHQMELIPLMGLSRKPGAPLPPVPTEADLEPVMKGEKKFAFDEYVADYAMWFLNRKERFRRDLFLGFGGYSMMYLPPDPNTVPPPLPDLPVVRQHPALVGRDIDALWETAFLLSAGFGAKSKAVFGKGFENDPSFAGISFIIPLMRSTDYHEANPEEVGKWFSVFDVFIQESPDDSGILIASRHDLDADLGVIIEGLRTAGIDHPSLPKEQVHDEQN